LKVLIAVPATSSGSPLPAAQGLRGEPVGIYQAGEVQVVLEGDEDAEHPARRRLTGIVVGADPAGLEAQLLRGDAEAVGTAPLDQFGNFSLPDLEAGAYTLIIRGGEPPLEIHIPGITL